jgi:phosphoribosylaminoimidazolecarboxamide formyltransferase/IMP cyclohydrolase
MLERLSGSKAFALLSRYDAEIADYFEQLGAETQEKEVPPHIDLSCSLLSTLRYGENPHQKAGFYSDKRQGWEVVHGKELSFNNILDIDASLRAIGSFPSPRS